MKSFVWIAVILFLFSSCSSVHYTYYNKRKVPYTAPEEVKFAKAVPSKPFLSQTETALRENPVQQKSNEAEKPVARNQSRENSVSKQEAEKISSSFDIQKYFSEHKFVLQAKDGGNIDQRTMIIVLLVVLILVLLALLGDGIFWLLWLALLILLVYALLKYLDLLN